MLLWLGICCNVSSHDGKKRCFNAVLVGDESEWQWLCQKVWGRVKFEFDGEEHGISSAMDISGFVFHEWSELKQTWSPSMIY